MRINKLLKLTTVAALLLNPAWSFADSHFTTEQKNEINGQIHDYLIKNPQVLVEAYHALENKAHNEMEQQAQKVAIDNAATLLQSSTTPIIGNTKGTLQLVEFYDYNCSHCRAMADTINQTAAKLPNLRVVFKQLPVFGANSEYAARAVVAANNQGKFLELHNALMKANKPLNKEVILEFAKSAGLDTTKLAAEVDSKSTTDELASSYKLANSLGISAVPMFILAKTAAPISSTSKPTITKLSIIPGEISQDKLAATINSF